MEANDGFEALEDTFVLWDIEFERDVDDVVVVVVVGGGMA